MPVSVLLIDDEVLVRQGFRNALEETADVVVVGEASRAAEGLCLARRHQPEVVLTADVTDLPRLRTCVTGGVIVLAWECTDERLHRVLTAGARGLLLKRASREELVAAVRAVAQGHAHLGAEVAGRLLDRFEILPPPEEADRGLGLLSDRERQVLVRIARGRSNDEIARELYLTCATVKSHVSHILAKLGQPNRMHAALLAQRLGLLTRAG
ncbi:LuxR C-terminal-related transcriptional regulator [Lentzea aerocolonigenes]|uniref:LuxR C-terminal-related transcriptional regulator n=1 Tax=Lentzea aerocolonigenes TaxID=68170 RepID=UPI0004C31AD0|nr:response regulator transcription factor [Lentzea aerocolonigenes]MCP2247285.1 DNA-binding response regulator, NarL/FixJ family, contains REC and HTH domains [Lentzea aerocolonigenes]